jgi:RNA polymerase sigma-70 factor (ECF subfamily)
MTKKRLKNPPVRKRHDNDTALIESIQAGSEAGYNELLRRYEKSLYNFGLRMCRNEGDAEDMVQETFLNIVRYVNRFRFETKFKNWLYRIAASVCIKKRRRSKFAPGRELSLDEIVPQEAVLAASRIPEWAAVPLSQLLNEELGRVIRDAIHALPAHYRLVVNLRDIEGFSTEETAQILDISEANVKVRLHRARHFMRQRLQYYFDDDT